MGWSRNRNWTLKRKHQNHWHVSHVYTTVNTDQQGNSVPEKWNTLWSKQGKNIRWAKRHTNHQLRQAAKRIIAYELYEDEQWQQELWEQQVGYEDEPMDCPYDELDWIDWSDIYEDPIEPEPEEDLYDPFWYDDYYSDCYY